MKKRSVILLVIIVPLVVIVSFGLGYMVAFVQSLQKVVDMDIRANCNVLLVDSLRMSRSSDIIDFIDKVENNYDDRVSFIRTNEYYSSPETKKKFAEALEAWEKAKVKLKEIKSQ